ncbi:MAG: hypothetical protein ACKODV_05330 [Candidatus Limnocylindrus sp.]
MDLLDEGGTTDPATRKRLLGEAGRQLERMDALTLERRSDSVNSGRAIPASNRESSRMLAVSASMRSS